MKSRRWQFKLNLSNVCHTHLANSLLPALLIHPTSRCNCLQALVAAFLDISSVFRYSLFYFLPPTFHGLGFRLFQQSVTLAPLDLSLPHAFADPLILSLLVSPRCQFQSLKMRRARGYHFRRVLNRKRRLRQIRGDHSEPMLAVGDVLRGLDDAALVDVAVSASGGAISRSDFRSGRSRRAVAETVLAQAVLIAEEHRRLGKAGCE